MADEADPGGSNSGTAPGRRAYSTPDIAWEEPLEDRPHLMAACTQRPGQDEACESDPTS
jgi:hypothetical protein